MIMKGFLCGFIVVGIIAGIIFSITARKTDGFAEEYMKKINTRHASIEEMMR